MLVPINWLREYYDFNDDIKSYADKITASGSHVDSILIPDSGIEGVLVGKILSIEKHSNAEKLLVTKVDVGHNVLQIVTGAKNMSVGDYVAVAVDGSKLPGDIVIKKADFRGILSEGMYCSLKELGYSDSVIPKELRDGILILQGEFPLGQDIKISLDIDECVMDFEITPNRPDCLSIIGMARETAATYGNAISLVEIPEEGIETPISEYFNVIQIQTPGCYRYIGSVIKDVEIKPSPQKIQNYLMNAGMRPINNIVDVTNFVMLEYGQPLHAFDLDKISDKTIIIRQAHEGEKMVTLDGTERTFSKEDILICDPEKAIGIAGVMGGFDTEVTSETKNILLESAVFNMESIRKTSKKLNLRSEASTRYEKGLSLSNADSAARRACQLIEKVGGGTPLKARFDEGLKENAKTNIPLRLSRAEQLLGVSLDKDEVAKILSHLSLDVLEEESSFIVGVPDFRRDLTSEVDLIEEIGRMIGFQNIQPQPIVGALTQGRKSDLRTVEDSIKTFMLGFGFLETLTYSFISPKVYDRLLIAENNPLRNVIQIMNPLGTDFSIMRSMLIGNMMESLERNYTYRSKEIALYEIGNIFIPNEGNLLPDEESHLCLGLYGSFDFYYVKNICTEIFDHLGIAEYSFKAVYDNTTYHSGRCAEIYVDDVSVGIIGELSYDAKDNYEIKDRVLLAELNLNRILSHVSLDKKYNAIGKYPSVNRDIALLVTKDIESDRITNIIKNVGGSIVYDVNLFDIYNFEGEENYSRSLAYNIVFKSKDRTLNDEEVNEKMAQIINELENTLSVKLRSN